MFPELERLFPKYVTESAEIEKQRRLLGYDRDIGGKSMNDELKAMTIIIVAVWVSVAMVVVSAVVVTHSAMPVWGLLIPVLARADYSTEKREEDK